MLNLIFKNKPDTIVAIGISAALSLLLLVPLFSIGLKSFLFLGGAFVVFLALSLSTFLIGNALSVRAPVFLQLAKFALVGGLSTAVELALLNLLFLIFGVTEGLGFSIFKTFTFGIALVNSYIFNKYWSFGAGVTVTHIEFGKFFLSNLVGLALNVGTASFIVNMLQSPYMVSSAQWANFAVVIAVTVTMTWNFFSYKFLVFRHS